MENYEIMHSVTINPYSQEYDCFTVCASDLVACSSPSPPEIHSDSTLPTSDFYQTTTLWFPFD